MKNQNILKDKSYVFAIRIVKFYKFLKEEKKEFVLSKQVLRSGTSIGAMVEEALQGESKMDFIHKLSIANKEANETRYWIRLLKDTDFIDEKLSQSLIHDLEEVIRLLVSIIKTTKNSVTK
ncbi:four helix bundle protein [Chryseobacterium camelliae]|uniref:Four helix bundle protein n=1 Tax=Chryseobacterium camelliae TaxID=1265445 RepID=A0ABY7QPI3_9FLAO|nr:four helix bundle protein [Chryseobacterium camelliae]WBV60668.1 four helix bundle protein [Chryseobacterium camelliae]